jgi:hypothetical protein
VSRLAVVPLAGVLAALLDVLGDELLERLQLVEELLRRDLAIRLGATEEPGGGLYRRPPTGLVGLVGRLRASRDLVSFTRSGSDRVEIDVAVGAALPW